MELSPEYSRDESDPVGESKARVRDLPFTPFGLDQESSWVQAPIPAFQEERRSGQLHAISVAYSYVPAFSLTEAPPASDTLEHLGAFKPDDSMLWEAVRTSWWATGQHPSLNEELGHHVRHVLHNRFSITTESEVSSTPVGVTVKVNGVTHPAVAVDSNPLVYAVGAEIDDVFLTVVVPRRLLTGISLTFTHVRAD